MIKNLPTLKNSCVRSCTIPSHPEFILSKGLLIILAFVELFRWGATLWQAFSRYNVKFLLISTNIICSIFVFTSFCSSKIWHWNQLINKILHRFEFLEILVEKARNYCTNFWKELLWSTPFKTNVIWLYSYKYNTKSFLKKTSCSFPKNNLYGPRLVYLQYTFNRHFFKYISHSWHWTTCQIRLCKILMTESWA